MGAKAGHDCELGARSDLKIAGMRRTVDVVEEEEKVVHTRAVWR